MWERAGVRWISQALRCNWIIFGQHHDMPELALFPQDLCMKSHSSPQNQHSFLPNSQMLWSLHSSFCIKSTLLSSTETNLDWQFLYILYFNTLPVFPCPELAFVTWLHSKNSVNLFDIRFSQIKKRKEGKKKKSLKMERKTLVKWMTLDPHRGSIFLF